MTRCPNTAHDCTPQRCRRAPNRRAGRWRNSPRECSGRDISQRSGFPHRSATAQIARVSVIGRLQPQKIHKAHCRAAARCKTPARFRNGCSVRRGRQRGCAPNVPQMPAKLTDRSSSSPQSTRRNGLSVCVPRARRSVGRSVGRSCSPGVGPLFVKNLRLRGFIHSCRVPAVQIPTLNEQPS
jgi:hypothetical protein